MSTAGTAGEIAGGVAGGAIGGAIGSIVPGVGTLIGRWVGSRVGRWAGRAAAEALVSALEGADAEVEEKEEDDAASETCADCGDIDCFNVPEGVDPEEFRRQLQMQQDAINGMSPDQLLGNIERFARLGRGVNDARARAAARRLWRRDRIAELMGEGMSKTAATAQARTEGRTLAALHELDLVAGGDGSIQGLGDARVNSSIGSQWNQKGSNGQYTRAEQLKQNAREARRQGADKMNVKLEICPEDEGAADSDAQTPSSGTPGPGDSGPGELPMS